MPAKNKKPKVRPSVEEIESLPDYELIRILSFEDMIPFVVANIKKRKLPSLIYFAANSGLMLFLIIRLMILILNNHPETGHIILSITAGIIAGSILIIPFHELIHGLFYRIVGAKKISFGADLSQLIFYVTSDRFPLMPDELTLLAASPFLVINILTLLLTLIVFPGTFLFTGFFLLSHNIMCIGDFALINYTRSFRQGIVISFDKVEKKESYFYKYTGN